jgi:hypothetical protein
MVPDDLTGHIVIITNTVDGMEGVCSVLSHALPMVQSIVYPQYYPY